ncbi:MAG: recombinase family protein [Flavobacteriales bacterium]|nr:recombinase family protein [Flavobacteriales bacterium]
MITILFTRVSNLQNTHDDQINNLTSICKKKNWSIFNIYKETGSGLISGNDRPVLLQMLKDIPSANVEAVIISNISRLSCKTKDVERLMKWLHNKNISIYLANLDILSIGNEDVIMEQARIADEQITQLKQNYAEGNLLKTGRKEGYKKSKLSILHDHADVAKLLNLGMSIRQVGKETGKSTNTVQKVKRLL